MMSPETNESVRAVKTDADSLNSLSADGDKGQANSPPLLHERCTEAVSPPKTPVSASLAESTQSASHSESSIVSHLSMGTHVFDFVVSCVQEKTL